MPLEPPSARVSADAPPAARPDLAQQRRLRALHLGAGFRALLGKELLRFWKVAIQTIVAPVVTTLLYLLIFAHVLAEHVRVYDGRVSYTGFLVPGLIMMSVLQNAFANSSSSLIQSKIMRNVIFILLPPLTTLELFLAYVLASVVRGLVVGLGVWLATLPLVPGAELLPREPLWASVFALLGSFALGTLGLIAGLWSEKFDHLAAFQNFLIVPLTFLAGVFYSIHSLPPFWQALSQANPFFFMIDGFRYGFFGVADGSPWRALAVTLGFAGLLAATALAMLASGYKLRS
ncbi:MAG: ABC transporter permease [Casimicrobiaceae bacterium]|nr:ABC transporter permease [Casimicrobiaceae bacterium]MCX8098435.1 ABC transporter permease [Casimicrobiaceae bacterium]MDW8311147.1 ABC transporter permease [Burkholderiales bacterium]